MAVTEGRITAVGDDAAVRRAAGPDADVVDLDGATVLPGFVDTHPHLLHFGVIAEPLVDLADAVDHSDIAARITSRAQTTPVGEWIMTTPVGEPHYFLRRSYRDLAEGVLPDRVVLDRAAPHHPVFIQAWAPVIPNTCVLNSAGLQRLGIDRHTADRIGDVCVEKDTSGEPTGRLHGAVTLYYNNDDSMNSLLRRLPLLQPNAFEPGVIRAMRAANALGVTTVYEAHAMDFSHIELYRWLRSTDQLTVRVQCAPEAHIYGMPDDQPLDVNRLLTRLQRATDMVDRDDDMLRIDGITVGRGGSCHSGQLLMREPYRGPFGTMTTGRSFVPADTVEKIMRFCLESGLRLNMMIAGNGELATYLDQLERLDGPLRVGDRPWIVQHAAIAEPHQIMRLAALRLGLTTTMSFSWGKGKLFAERVGQHILEHLVPLQRFLDAGMTVGCGTDWGPKNVFEHLALAVEPRYGATGRPAATAGISRTEALAMWTRTAAEVLGWERIGSLVVDHHADLVVVDRNPLTCRLADLTDTRVLATMLGGRTVTGSMTDATASTTPAQSRRVTPA
ncbi:amidohydrolase [Mycolicibacterium arseniciresistens]|uniref:Amidohydrolase family protein n=1 Tax=Mycolicibacterium arseniciresistens TaxID=3062257 RepID=A0ABT8UC34_9MYCO|nr:amidohydrolase family protein [Mycolicibacterium arseniciresistens]MDO3635349.1 amidohydrolase family protein [Mycolicibacterium arseniciresistens]